MDFGRAVQGVIPGVQGRILAVLVEATGELNLRTIARLSGVSPAQASRVLPDLVDMGIVERREVPPSALFQLVREHVVSQALLDIAAAPAGVLDAMRHAADVQPVPPAGVIVFGSFARGEADGASDIDVVLVRPADVDDEEDGWGESVEGWRRAVRRASGNRVEVLEVPLEEIAAKLVSEEPLWRDVRHEGVVVLGPSLHELTGDRAG